MLYTHVPHGAQYFMETAHYKQRTLWRVTKTTWQNQRGSFEYRRPLRAPSWREEAFKVVLWQPARGTTNRGRRHFTFIDNLKKDTGLESVSEIKTAMMDKATWRELVNSAPENSRPRLDKRFATPRGAFMLSFLNILDEHASVFFTTL